jgi:hypothetical protein
MSSNINPCFTATGGFSTVQGFDTIVQRTETPIALIDFTGALEVYFDVRTFNNLIGIQKDVSNINVITSGYFDNTNDILLQDSLSIPATAFVSGLNSKASNVASVGRYSTFYSDFAQYIANYFSLPTPTSNPTGQGLPHGFATLYSNEYDFYPNNGVFDGQAFIDILKPSPVDAYGAYVSPLSGTIELTGITSALRNAVTANPFNNRNRTTGTTASDVLDRTNYGVSDGFFAGDVIYISGGPLPPTGTTATTGYYGNGTVDGISLTLKLIIDPKTPNANVSGLDVVTRNQGAPLVIRLANLSTCVLSATLSTITTTSILILITGTYSSFIVTRSVAGAAAVVYTAVTLSGQNYQDTGLTTYTQYIYVFTPVDANGNSGVPQTITVTTSKV